MTDITHTANGQLRDGVEHASLDLTGGTTIEQRASTHEELMAQPPYIKQPDGRFHCPSCEFDSSTPQAVSSHRYRIHGTAEERAALSAKLSAAQIARRDAGLRPQRRKSAAPVVETHGRPRERKRFLIAELEEIVHHLPVPERRTLLHRYAEAKRSNRDLRAWEERKLSALRADAKHSAAQPKQLALVDADPVAAARAAERALRDERAAADRLFETVADLTDQLFPDRVPSNRILEVAGWQQETMRMMTR